MGTSSDLDAATRGDRDALGRLLSKHREKLESMARQHLGKGLRDHLRTSDVLQSTFIQVVSHLPDFRGRSEDEFLAWTLEILKNRVRGKHRYFEAKKRKIPTVDEPHPIHKVEESDALAKACRAEELAVLDEALRALPKDYQTILRLRAEGNTTHESLAKLLERSPAATRTLLSRARSALALEIERVEAEKRSKGPDRDPSP